MIRKFFAASLVVALMSVYSQSASAQDGFQPGYLDVGPALGLGGVAGVGTSIGARLEKGIKTLPSMGDGILGIQAFAQFASLDRFTIGGSWFFLGATANYHFKMNDTKFDPFLGLGLGYSNFSWDVDCTGCSSSTINFAGRLGARYFFAEKLAGYADVGTGGSTINLGVMFKLK